MTIYVTCKVTGASEEYRKMLEEYVDKLEKQGHEVHLPHRDTDQNQSGYDICIQNLNATLNADEVHIFYDETSKGTHFDMGMAFALDKPIVYVDIPEDVNPRTFQGMLKRWHDASKGE